MTKSNLLVLFILFVSGYILVHAAQQNSAPGLKEVAVRDAACTQLADSKENDPTLTETPIRSAGRDVGTIIEVQGACHCQEMNCDSLVYLPDGHGGYRLALHEKYASLHPMKIVKLGMPSLTGQFEVSANKMETTVYDWDGKDYKPSLCATVVKGSRVPAITRHPCKVAAK